MKSRTKSPRHPAWTMVAVAGLALIAAGSFTTIAGLITEPLVEYHGWSRSEIGVGVAINMILYGAIAPFSAALMDHYGLRRVTGAALSLLIAGTILLSTATPSSLWFILWWGFVVGCGTGSVTMVFGATVANRWFRQRIGLATGLLTASSVVGQFAALPLLSAILSRTDWRGPIVAAGALAAVALGGVLGLLRDRPADIGVSRYGATSTDLPSDPPAGNPFGRTIATLLECLRDRRFWVLAMMFYLCGATTNGLMWSHFTPAAHDHGMAATSASVLLALIGIANIAGTVTAGWLSDRIRPGILLAVFFTARGAVLLALPAIFTDRIDVGLSTFAVLFGILDVATVPPTLALCRSWFGGDSALAFGWVNVFHQVGAGSMALCGGIIRDLTGSYTPMWLAAAALCLIAAFLGVSSTRVPDHISSACFRSGDTGYPIQRRRHEHAGQRRRPGKEI